MAVVVYIGIGSNMPDGDKRITDALAFLSDHYAGFACSDVYNTPSVSLGDDSVYFNSVARCSVADLRCFEQEMKQYETACGRVHADKSVVIDLDVVVAGDEILRPRDFGREYFQIGYRQLNG